MTLHFEGPFSLGMWQQMYKVGDGVFVHFVRGGANLCSSDPDRIWMMIISDSQERNVHHEERLFDDIQVMQLCCEVSTSGGVQFGVREADIQRCVAEMQRVFQEESPSV